MASRKISELTALTAPATADVLPIVDVSEAAPENQNKKITYGELLASAPAGSAAAPAFAFDGDPDTGVYNPGANQVALATNGVQRVTVDTAATTSTLPVVHPLGAAATPSVTFTGDLNTGIYSPGADQVAISTGGTGRLFVNASGNIGIASASVQSLGGGYSTLEIKGKSGGYGGGIILSPSDANTAPAIWYYDGNCTFGSNTSTPVVFLTGGTEKLRLTSAGNVGIGTASPSKILHVVEATQQALFEGSAQGSIVLQKAGTLGMGLISDQAGSLAFYNLNGNNERARIDSSGRLLVGTAAARTVAGATGNLQVEGTTNAYPTVVANRADVGGPGIFLGKTRGSAVGSNTVVLADDQLGQIRFFGADGTGLVEGASIFAYVDGTPGANDMPGRLVFSTTADGAASPTERMRLTSTGQLRLAGAGITFNGDTATANELDDYEEGTWTPVFRDGTAGTAATQTDAQGRYTKIGNLVRYYFHLLNVTTTGLTAGNTAYVTGLPFAAAQINNAEYDALATVNSATPTTGCVSFNVQNNQTYGLLANQTTTGQVVFTVSQATSGNFDMFVQGTYHVA